MKNITYDLAFSHLFDVEKAVHILKQPTLYVADNVHDFLNNIKNLKDSFRHKFTGRVISENYHLIIFKDSTIIPFSDKDEVLVTTKTKDEIPLQLCHIYDSTGTFFTLWPLHRPSSNPGFSEVQLIKGNMPSYNPDEILLAYNSKIRRSYILKAYWKPQNTSNSGRNSYDLEEMAKLLSQNA